MKKSNKDTERKEIYKDTNVYSPEKFEQSEQKQPKFGP